MEARTGRAGPGNDGLSRLPEETGITGKEMEEGKVEGPRNKGWDQFLKGLPSRAKIVESYFLDSRGSVEGILAGRGPGAWCCVLAWNWVTQT